MRVQGFNPAVFVVAEAGEVFMVQTVSGEWSDALFMGKATYWPNYTQIIVGCLLVWEGLTHYMDLNSRAHIVNGDTLTIELRVTTV